MAEAEAFGECGGVHIHDHIDEGFDFGGFSGGADVAEGGGEFFQEWSGAFEGFGFAAAHEEEGTIPGLGDTGSHAGFEALGSGGIGFGFGPGVGGGAERGAIDEEFTAAAFQEAAVEDGLHGFVIGDDGEDGVGVFGYVGEGLGWRGLEFGGELAGGFGVEVMEGAEGVAAILEAAGHIGSHASEADDTDMLDHGGVM